MLDGSTMPNIIFYNKFQQSTLHLPDHLMSRVIVKNIPTHLSEKDLNKHFSAVGSVTDVKVMKN